MAYRIRNRRFFPRRLIRPRVSARWKTGVLLHASRQPKWAEGALRTPVAEVTSSGEEGRCSLWGEGVLSEPEHEELSLEDKAY